jgi:hypothetical protein
VYGYLVKGVSGYDATPSPQGDDEECDDYPEKGGAVSLDTITTVASLDVKDLEAETTLQQQHNGNRVQRNQQNGTAISKSAKVRRFGGDSQLPPATNLKHGEASYPNFYVRVGAVCK